MVKYFYWLLGDFPLSNCRPLQTEGRQVKPVEHTAIAKGTEGQFSVCQQPSAVRTHQGPALRFPNPALNSILSNPNQFEGSHIREMLFTPWRDELHTFGRRSSHLGETNFTHSGDALHTLERRKCRNLLIAKGFFLRYFDNCIRL